MIDDASGTDQLNITGYAPGEMTVVQRDPARNELVLTFAGSSDEVVLRWEKVAVSFRVAAAG